MEAGDRKADAVALTIDAADGARIEQLINRDLEDVGDLAVGWRQPWARRPGRDNWIQPEAAHRNVERCQRAEHAHAVAIERDLLVRFAQRRLLERLARFDDAAGKRDLAGMPRRFAAHGEHDARGSVERFGCAV